MRKFMQRGLRYFVGLVDAALDDDIAIGVAVPNMHRYRYISEAESPRPQLQLDVLDGGASSRRGRGTREVSLQRGAQLRTLHRAASQAGRVLLIHASALSGSRCPWRSPAAKAIPTRRGVIGTRRC